MKANVEIPDNLIDAATKAELKNLRVKNTRLVSLNEQLKRQLREHDDQRRVWNTARTTVLELAELFDIEVQ